MISGFVLRGWWGNEIRTFGGVCVGRGAALSCRKSWCNRVDGAESKRNGMNLLAMCSNTDTYNLKFITQGFCGTDPIAIRGG